VPPILTGVPEPTLECDTAFEILKNERRRLLLCLLARCDSPITLRTATKSIIEETRNEPDEEVTEAEYRSLYVSLYQNHVPKLVEADLVEFDDDRRLTLSKGPETREVLRLLGFEFGDPWDIHYIITILSATSAGVVVGVAMSAYWTGAIVSLVVLSAGLALVGVHQYLTAGRDWQPPWHLTSDVLEQPTR
jgi:hypothetical protein